MELIKNIDIGFENCEICTLLPDMFKYLIVNGIKEDFNINCFQYENGEIIKSKTCEEFSIIINKRGLNSITWNGTLKERLIKFKDIVSVIIHYDKREEEIYVPWCEKNEFLNEYQQIEKTEEGIRVSIKK